MILAGPGSRLAVVETYAGPAGAATCTNTMTQVVVGLGATVDHYKIQDEADTGFHLGLLDVRQGPDSRFSSLSVALGSRIARHEVRVRLEGEGAHTTINGLYLPGGDRHHDNPVLIVHAAPRCTSRQLYKGIATDRGHGVFNGRLVVLPGAPGTDASQTNKNLLLSDHAEIDTRPRLEILTDDVNAPTAPPSGRSTPTPSSTSGRVECPSSRPRPCSPPPSHARCSTRSESEPLRTHLETLVAAHLTTQPTPDGSPGRARADACCRHTVDRRQRSDRTAMSPTHATPVELAQDCDVTLIPSGQTTTLPAGEKIVVTQALGGTVTVQTASGQLARISPEDAHALGLAVEPGEPRIVAVGPLRIRADHRTTKDRLRPGDPGQHRRPRADIRMRRARASRRQLPGRDKNVDDRPRVRNGRCSQTRRSLPGPDSSRRVSEVDVEVVWDPPWDQSRLTDAARLELGLY